MINEALAKFVVGSAERQEITKEDVRRLQREILPHGITSHDEADLLIALDRTLVDKDASWHAYTLGAIVGYVVWTSRPTGYVDQATARWLTASLGAGCGPTGLALAIAFDVIREAEQVDEALTCFAMRWSAGRSVAPSPLSDIDFLI